MSIEAITYTKTLDLGKAEPARLLLYAIAENTFNDSGLCRIGKRELMYQTRRSKSTVQRWAALLEDSNIIKVVIKPGNGGGRDPDEISIVGFLEWLARLRTAANPPSSGKDRDQPPRVEGQGVKLTPWARRHDSRVKRGGKASLVTPSYKDSRTSDSRTRGTRERAQDLKLNFESEGKAGSGVRKALFDLLGHAVYQAWFENFEILEAKGDCLKVAVPTKFHRNWISTHHEQQLLDCCRVEFPAVRMISYVVREGVAP